MFGLNLFVFFCGNVLEYTVYWWTENAALLQCHIIGDKSTAHAQHLNFVHFLLSSKNLDNKHEHLPSLHPTFSD